jgi:acyl carrier protein
MSAAGDTAQRIRGILSQVLGVPESGIGSGFSAASNPEWTSLNHLMLMSQLESEFGVFFSNQEIQDLNSFDRIVEAIAKRSASGA